MVQFSSQISEFLQAHPPEILVATPFRTSPSNPFSSPQPELSSISSSPHPRFLNFNSSSQVSSRLKSIKAENSKLVVDQGINNGKPVPLKSNIGNSTNIVWHACSIEKIHREELLQQKGCVIWITGLSGSGKSTLACALSRGLHARGKLTYILDGDNVRHGLNHDLSFRGEDRVENIRRMGEVGKLFADADAICIASLISPYRKDRDACRALLKDGDFIEVFMDVPLEVCEARDPKGLYKLARSGKIRGFTGIDDPYEAPLNCEITLHMSGTECSSPSQMAETVVSY